METTLQRLLGELIGVLAERREVATHPVCELYLSRLRSLLDDLHEHGDARLSAWWGLLGAMRYDGPPHGDPRVTRAWHAFEREAQVRGGFSLSNGMRDGAEAESDGS